MAEAEVVGEVGGRLTGGDEIGQVGLVVERSGVCPIAEHAFGSVAADEGVARHGVYGKAVR